MCDQHSTELVRVPIPADLSYTGRDRWAWKGIDPCIAPLVRALNDVGAPTRASCCGHGHRPGNIVLADGREVFIVPDFATGRRVDGLFPISSYGEEIARDATRV